jgi:hypothetical protein
LFLLMPPFPELKDITPPAPPPFSSPEEIQRVVWLVYAGVIAAAVLAGLWVWWRARRRHRRPPPLPLSPVETARRELERLRALAPELEPAALGHQLVEVLRRFLERRHGMLARYRTTDELLGAARHRSTPPLPFLLPFAEVLTRCDNLKFAGLELPAGERTALVAAARAALDTPPTDPAPAPPPPPPDPAAAAAAQPGPASDPAAAAAASPPALTPPLPHDESPDARSAASPPLPPGPPPRPALAGLPADSFTHSSDRGAIIPS